MKTYTKSLLIFISILFISTLVYFMTNPSVGGKEEQEELYHSATMNILVTERSKKDGYSVKVRNLNTPYQEFYIKIDDERLWNLIKTNTNYFVNVNWKSPNTISNITDQETELLQIEYLEKQGE